MPSFGNLTMSCTRWHAINIPQITVASQKELNDCTLIYKFVTAHDIPTVEGLKNKISKLTAEKVNIW